MKRWHTCGAFGNDVVELSVFEWLGMLLGREVEVGGAIVSLGRSKQVAHPNNYAGSREQQLRLARK